MIVHQEDQKLHVQGDDLPRLPTPPECTTHLRLMTTFAYLKQDITETQDLFFPDTQLSHSDSPTDLAEARWTIYVTRAASRYEKWFLSLASKQSTAPISTDVLKSKVKLERFLGSVKPLEWSVNMLPSVDVLMCLHAAMLNPRWFAEDCLRNGLMGLWKVGMPWSLIGEYIDQDTFEYKPPPSAEANFERLTGLSWNNLDDAESKLFDCALCGADSTPDKAKLSIEEWISSEEPTALYRLPCRNKHHLEHLKITHLQSDVRAFHSAKTPLRGTILTDKGLIQSDSSLRPHRDFCARLLTNTRISSPQTLQSYFDTLKSATSNTRLAKRNPLASHPTHHETYTLSRTTLSYLETPHALSIDPAAATLRQGTFIAQMLQISWLFAPPKTLHPLLSDIIDRYGIFLQIMRSSSASEISVPTLAVDLAWHTHQLTPSNYYNHTTKVLGSVFFDHDDRVSDADLTPAFQRTSQRYEVLSGGEEYSECLCWVCVAGDEVERQDEENEVVVSEKDGVQGGDVDERVKIMVRKAQLRKFEHDFGRAVRKGRVCDREEFVKGYVWLYPDMAPEMRVR